MGERFAVVVVGGGIVGLATAHALAVHRPDLAVAVLEKERTLGAHQTGHNSGVLHSGLFYAPGSRKAQLTLAGRTALLAFCTEERLPARAVGKLVVATHPSELPALDELEARGRANGVPDVHRLSAVGLQEAAPGAAGLAALSVPSAAIVDFRAIAERLGERLIRAGGVVYPGAEVVGAARDGPGWELSTDRGSVRAEFVINCAGLGSDLLALRMGLDPGVRIVPFRGDFFEVEGVPRAEVRTLLYPVPDPRFPFAGVHLTPTVDGRLLAGPTAALALAREGYRRGRVDARELYRLATFPGVRAFLARHPAVAGAEWLRSWSRAEFLAHVRRLWPGVTKDDLGSRRSGVRAQAIRADGRLEEDFVLLRDRGALHVVNAPSPAATSSFAIAEEIVRVAGLWPEAEGEGGRAPSARAQITVARLPAPAEVGGPTR